VIAETRGPVEARVRVVPRPSALAAHHGQIWQVLSCQLERTLPSQMWLLPLYHLSFLVLAIDFKRLYKDFVEYIMLKIICHSSISVGDKL
jgi:hypothetical protein